MNFKEFTSEVMDRLNVRFLESGEECVINTGTVLKNNGVCLTGVTINRGSRVCPAIYLEPYYRRHEQGMDMEEIVTDIVKLDRERIQNDAFDVEEVLSEDNVLENIVVRLVNYEKNQKTFENAPYIRFLDLAVVFRRIIRFTVDTVASTAVTNSDMERWGVDLDELYRKGLENTRRLYPPMKKNLFDLLKERYSWMPFQSDTGEARGELYIVSNTSNTNGAAVVLYDDILGECAAMVDDDIYIMPSSVHEMLFVAAGSEFDENYMRALVKESNADVVSKEDYLSDNIYIYTRKDGKLAVV